MSIFCKLESDYNTALEHTPHKRLWVRFLPSAYYFTFSFKVASMSCKTVYFFHKRGLAAQLGPNVLGASKQNLL